VKPRAIRRTAILVALMSVGVVTDAWAQTPSSAREAQRAPSVTQADSALDASTRELAAQLRCPVCQGLSIQDSPSELAQQMRDVVRQQLHDGQSPDQVKQFFVARYGQWILMAPPASGFNWLVYALPAVALIGGIALVVVLVRRWTTAPDAPGPVDALPAPDPSEATQ
jgi:cytochrome c-type biogenesis protein CcmH